MGVANRSFTQSIAGLSFNASDSLTYDNAVLADPPALAAAKVGVLTTRTDNDTGTFTMNAGHGWISTDRIDLYWSGGSRYGMTATMTGDSAVLDGGTGDNLPAAATAITAMKPNLETFNLVGNDAVVIGAAGDAAFTVLFVNGGTVHLAVRKNAAGGYVWVTGDGTNPLAGLTVASVYLSHGSSAQAVSVRAAAGRNT